MARVAAQLPGPEPAMAAKEREPLALLDGAATVETREWLTSMLRSLSSDPGAMQRAYDLYVRMDELAYAAVDDPRVAAVAQAMADAVPDGVRQAMTRAAADEALAADEYGSGFTEVFLAEYAVAGHAARRGTVPRLFSWRSSHIRSP
jgi:hypothetical protein